MLMTTSRTSQYSSGRPVSVPAYAAGNYHSNGEHPSDTHCRRRRRYRGFNGGGNNAGGVAGGVAGGIAAGRGGGGGGGGGGA